MERPNTGGQPMDLGQLMSQGYQTVSLDADAVEVGSETLAEYLNPNTANLQPDVSRFQGAGVADVQQVASEEQGAEGLTNQPQNVSGAVDNQLVADLQSELANVRQQAQIAQELLVQAANEKAAAEERAFIESLKDEDEAVAAKKLLDYRTRQYQARERFLTGRLENIAKQADSDQQAIAKRQVAFILATENGLPREMVQFLDTAISPDDMRQKAALLGQMVKGQTQAQRTVQRQARVQSGVDVAGGDRSGNVPPKEPKKFGGDILGYIRSRPRQRVDAWE
jgi:hypothetical protein